MKNNATRRSIDNIDSGNRLEAGRPTGAQSAQIEQRLRHVTVDLFLDRGFDAVSMEDVARAAGITKPTLYARYRDKNALFADAIIWTLARYRSLDSPADIDGLEPRQAMLEIARSALKRALHPEIARLNRLAMFEAPNFPHFAAEAYAATWSSTVKATTDILTAHLGRGESQLKLIQRAATQFVAMIGQGVALSTAFGLNQADEFDEEYLECAVDIVMNGVQALMPKR
jgi:AcrR family transcriptional regulator